VLPNLRGCRPRAHRGCTMKPSFWSAARRAQLKQSGSGSPSLCPNGNTRPSLRLGASGAVNHRVRGLETRLHGCGATSIRSACRRGGHGEGVGRWHGRAQPEAELKLVANSDGAQVAVLDGQMRPSIIEPQLARASVHRAVWSCWTARPSAGGTAGASRSLTWHHSACRSGRPISEDKPMHLACGSGHFPVVSRSNGRCPAARSGVAAACGRGCCLTSINLRPAAALERNESVLSTAAATALSRS
jgi:hypothetical protein